MLGLPKKTEVNVEINVEDLYNKLSFHHWRRENISRKIMKMTIINQLDCKEIIKEKEHYKEIEKKLYIIRFINEDIDELYDDKEISNYLYNSLGMLSDIMEQIGQDAIYVICDKKENVRAAFFKEGSSHAFNIIDNAFKIYLDKDDNEIRAVYKNIIEQIDDYYNLRDYSNIDIDYELEEDN